MNTLAMICVICAAIPALLIILNVLRYRRVPNGHASPVSVLIPARNEEENIGDCLVSVLAAGHSEMEIIVLDDHSTDRTSEIVATFASRGVRLLSSKPLPAGWCGKQFACHQLAQAATQPLFIFLDADVRLEPGAIQRITGALNSRGVDLISGVPRQITVSLSEKLLIPLIHFILLGFLPFGMMRRFRHPAFAAGCGQLFAARAESYWRAGGHETIAASGHDGIELPRAFRKARLQTDLFDATDLARCRMYSSGRAVWTGLAKNAREGMAKPVLLPAFTLLLLFGQVLPPLLLLASLVTNAHTSIVFLFGVGTTASHAARAICTLRFGQSWLGTLFHSLSIAAFLCIQWWAALQEKRGRPMHWKGRAQPRLAGLALALLLAASQTAAQPIHGPDQFGRARTIQFPADKLIVLTMADREGADEMDHWIATLKENLGDRVAYEGVADVTKVPSFLRGMIQKRFAKKYDRPIILDWSGTITARFRPIPGSANIFLLDRSGAELARFSGEPSKEKVSTALAEVTRHTALKVQ